MFTANRFKHGLFCNAQKKFPADLITFTEEILNGKRHFCAVL